MADLNFVKDYKHLDPPRQSFNALAMNTFGISFETWYQKGFWNDRYIPYSFSNGRDIIANVSVNLVDLVIHGEKKRAVQIGTVMTHPDYRKRGLSAQLMNRVLEEYENQVDFLYLFANRTVLDFYPRFGFKPVEEHQYWLNCSSGTAETQQIRRLNAHDSDDLRFIYQFVSERVPVSRRFATDHAQGIFMFYCLNVFGEDIYYLEDEDVIAVFHKENNALNIFDVVSRKDVDILAVVKRMAGEDTNKVIFHFTPEHSGFPIESGIFQGSEVLFVRALGRNDFPVHMKHPMMSQA